MAALRTSLVKRKHAWTGADVPWYIDVEEVPSVLDSVDAKKNWRLFHYLSGGGLSAFGTSSERIIVERRQTRFLRIACALAVLWLVFWII
jgi:hypothetical protein